jgi:hypothetical protein
MQGDWCGKSNIDMLKDFFLHLDLGHNCTKYLRVKYSIPILALDIKSEFLPDSQHQPAKLRQGLSILRRKQLSAGSLD